MTYNTKGKKKTGKNVTIKRRRRRSLKSNGTKRFKKRGGGGKKSVKKPHNYEKVTDNKGTNVKPTNHIYEKVTNNSGSYNRLRVLGTDSMVNANRGCLVMNRMKNNKKSPSYNILAARGTKTLVKNKLALEERNKKNLKGGVNVKKAAECYQKCYNSNPNPIYDMAARRSYVNPEKIYYEDVGNQNQNALYEVPQGNMQQGQMPFYEVPVPVMGRPSYKTPKYSEGLYATLPRR